MYWTKLHQSCRQEDLGELPSMLDESDARSAKEQLDEAYGWRKLEGFAMNEKGDLLYPGDPPIPALAECLLHEEEVVRLYFRSWVAIIQPSGEFEVARMD